MKDKHIEAHMKTAYNYAECSTAEKLKVGAIIVKDNRILSIGYNGTPSGWDNCCEDRKYLHNKEDLLAGWDETVFSNEDGSMYILKTKPEVNHAERNALDKLTRSHESSEGAIMFCTHAPCLECAKSIANTGIVGLYYAETYRSEDGLNHLDDCGVEVIKLEKQK